jgi:hypothetical protein
MGVVGGEAHDRLAALAGANVGRGQPLDLLLDRSGRINPYDVKLWDVIIKPM